MNTPALDQHLRLPQRVEDLAIEQLISKLAVERLYVAVLPRAPGLDEKRLDADTPKPVAYDRGGELRPVIATNVLGNTSRHKQPR